jgi:uncharacterized protein
MNWGPEDHIRVDRIGPEEGLRLLRRGQIARVVHVLDGAPVIERVAYRVVEEDIILRTALMPVVEAAQRRDAAALEVDDDMASRVGTWSVSVYGALSEIDDPDDIRRLNDLWFLPQPHDTEARYVRLTPRTVTGERRRYEPARATVVLDEASPTT